MWNKIKTAASYGIYAGLIAASYYFLGLGATIAIIVGVLVLMVALYLTVITLLLNR